MRDTRTALGWTARIGAAALFCVPISAPTILADGAHAASNPTPVRPSMMIDWDAQKDGDPHAYTVQGISVVLRSARDGAGNVVPEIVAITLAGQRTSVQGLPGSDVAKAEFGVGPFDPTNRVNQILFMSYSGGAHCCTDVKVIEFVDDKWNVISLGAIDGIPPGFPSDIDGDGIPELVLRDGRFLNVFGSYADSWSPPSIYQLRDSKLADVSASRQFAKTFEADMRAAEKGCLRHNNGACVGFVGDAARAGHLASAWQVMLANYRHDQVELCTKSIATCRGTPTRGHPDFPAALAAFLRQTNYINEDEEKLLARSVP